MLSRLVYPTDMDRRLAGLLLATLAIALLWAGLQPRLSPPGEYGIDKILHAGAFGFLAVLGTIALRHKLAPLLSMAGVAFVGALLEVAQGQVKGRVGSLEDWIADMVGIVLAVALYQGFRAYAQRRLPAPA